VTIVLDPAQRHQLLEEPTQEQLRDLRALLTAAEFNVSAVCRRLDIPSIYEFRSIREGRTSGCELQDRLDLLIRLFMDVEVLEGTVVERLLPPRGAALLETLGL